MKKHRVAQVGIGNRGKIHANAFLELSDRFELAGLCDLDQEKLNAYAGGKNHPTSFTLMRRKCWLKPGRMFSAL